MNTKLLLPNRFKKIGWFILIPAIIAYTFLTVTDWNIKLPDSKVFALYSDPILIGNSTVTSSGHICTIENGNYTFTLIGLLIIIGGIFVGFSKEKHEDEFIAKTRQESLVWAIYVNYAILAFCFLFFFDLEFLRVMIYNMFTPLVIFIVRFYYTLYKFNRSLTREK
jgi:LPXTG-motif cell wall-anchored protein